jgi:TRAP-type mannitol/chloroaromatic compound transport system permease large subunit
MSHPALGLAMLGLSVLAIMLGFPTAFTLMGLGMLFGFVAFWEPGLAWYDNHIFDLMVQRTYGVMNNDTLLSVPLFVFMGYVMERAALVDRMFHSVQLAFRRVPASLAVTTLLVCAFWGIASGIVGAVVVLMGVIAMRPMLRAGYDVRLAAGAITAGGTLGILIPPSVMLIVYAAVAGVSIVKLYAAAMLPGLFLTFLYLLFILGWALLNPKIAPKLSLDQYRLDVPEWLKGFERGPQRRVLGGLATALLRPGTPGSAEPAGYGNLIKSLTIAVVPLALTLATFGGTWWYVVVHSAAPASALAAPAGTSAARTPDAPLAEPAGPEELGSASLSAAAASPPSAAEPTAPEELGGPTGASDAPEELGAVPASNDAPEELGATPPGDAPEELGTPAGSEMPEELGAAPASNDAPEELGTPRDDDAPEELGAAPDANDAPEELGAPRDDDAPEELGQIEGATSLGRASAQRAPGSQGAVPDAFFGWFWSLAGVALGLLVLYYRRFDGERLEILKQLVVSVLPLGILTIVVLAVILFGVTTATESAAIGALSAVYLAVMAKHPREVWLWTLGGAAVGCLLGAQRHDGLTLFISACLGGVFAGTFGPWLKRGEARRLWHMLKQPVFLTAKTTAMVCWLFVGSALFSAVFALHGGQALIERWVLGMDLSAAEFLIVSQLIIFVLGWPLEWTEIIVIFCPIFIPLLGHFQVDPILFGTMVAVNLQAAFLSPPVAMSAFYLKGVSPPHVTLRQIFAGMVPYMFIVLLCLIIMHLWPGMTLWLPEFLYGP